MLAQRRLAGCLTVALAVTVGFGGAPRLAMAVPGSLSPLGERAGCIGGPGAFAREFGGIPRQRCVRIRGRSGHEDSVSFVDSARDSLAVLTPDARYLYAATRPASLGQGGRRHSAIGVFARAASGTLRQLRGAAGCVSASGRFRCRRVRLLAGISALAMSPDGRHIYGATAGSASIVVLNRNTLTGALRLVAGRDGCVRVRRRASKCRPGRGVRGIYSLVVSADDRNLYAASADGFITTFSRDQRTGALRQLRGAAGCLRLGARRLSTRGCPVRAPSNNGFSELELSANSDTVIFASPYGNDDSVLFRRAPSDGALEFIPLCQSGCKSGTAAGALWLSPDGSTAYVADTQGRVTLWHRDQQNGRLTTPEIVFEVPCRSSGGCYRGAAALRATADGLNVYASFNEFGVLALSRDPASGRLARLAGRTGCVALSRRPGCDTAPGLLAPDALLMPSDERHLYVVTEHAEIFAVTALRREPQAPG